MMSEGSRSLVNWMRLELEPDRARERLRERRLADPRHVLDENVAAREDRDDRLAHGLRLATHHRLHVLLEAPNRARHGVVGGQHAARLGHGNGHSLTNESCFAINV